MSTMPVRSRFESWRSEAPWAVWDGRRRLAVALLFTLPFLIGGAALVASLAVGLCGLGEGPCTAEEEQQIAVLSTVVWASYCVVVAGAGLLFLLRRRLFWLVGAVLGLLGFLDLVL